MEIHFVGHLLFKFREMDFYFLFGFRRCFRPDCNYLSFRSIFRCMLHCAVQTHSIAAFMKCAGGQRRRDSVRFHSNGMNRIRSHTKWEEDFASSVQCVCTDYTSHTHMYYISAIFFFLFARRTWGVHNKNLYTILNNKNYYYFMKSVAVRLTILGSWLCTRFSASSSSRSSVDLTFNANDVNWQTCCQCVRVCVARRCAM